LLGVVWMLALLKRGMGHSQVMQVN
jgi:hypothetical protein